MDYTCRACGMGFPSLTSMTNHRSKFCAARSSMTMEKAPGSAGRSKPPSLSVGSGLSGTNKRWKLPESPNQPDKSFNIPEPDLRPSNADYGSASASNKRTPGKSGGANGNILMELERERDQLVQREMKLLDTIQQRKIVQRTIDSPIPLVLSSMAKEKSANASERRRWNAETVGFDNDNRNQKNQNPVDSPLVRMQRAKENQYEERETRMGVWQDSLAKLGGTPTRNIGQRGSRDLFAGEGPSPIEMGVDDAAPEHEHAVDDIDDALSDGGQTAREMEQERKIERTVYDEKEKRRQRERDEEIRTKGDVDPEMEKLRQLEAAADAAEVNAREKERDKLKMAKMKMKLMSKSRTRMSDSSETKGNPNTLGGASSGSDKGGSLVVGGIWRKLQRVTQAAHELQNSKTLTNESELLQNASKVTEDLNALKMQYNAISSAGKSDPALVSALMQLETVLAEVQHNASEAGAGVAAGNPMNHYGLYSTPANPNMHMHMQLPQSQLYGATQPMGGMGGMGMMNVTQSPMISGIHQQLQESMQLLKEQEEENDRIYQAISNLSVHNSSDGHHGHRGEKGVGEMADSLLEMGSEISNDTLKVIEKENPKLAQILRRAKAKRKTKAKDKGKGKGKGKGRGKDVMSIGVHGEATDDVGDSDRDEYGVDDESDAQSEGEENDEFAAIKAEQALQLQKMKYEAQIMRREIEMTKLKRELEREKDEAIKERDRRQWVEQQRRDLIQAKLKKNLGREMTSEKSGSVNGGDPTKYNPAEGLSVFFDYVVGLPLRAQHVTLAYGFFEGNVSKSSVLTLDMAESEHEDSLHNRATFAVQRKFKQVPALPSMKIVVEVQLVVGIPQNPGEAARTQSSGWTILEPFDGQEALRSGFFRLPIFRPPVNISATTSDLQAMPRQPAFELFVRVCTAAQAADHAAVIVNPLLGRQKYGWAPGFGTGVLEQISDVARNQGQQSPVQAQGQGQSQQAQPTDAAAAVFGDSDGEEGAMVPSVNVIPPGEAKLSIKWLAVEPLSVLWPDADNDSLDTAAKFRVKVYNGSEIATGGADGDKLMEFETEKSTTTKWSERFLAKDPVQTDTTKVVLELLEEEEEGKWEEVGYSIVEVVPKETRVVTTEHKLPMFFMPVDLDRSDGYNADADDSIATVVCRIHISAQTAEDQPAAAVAVAEPAAASPVTDLQSQAAQSPVQADAVEGHGSPGFASDAASAPTADDRYVEIPVGIPQDAPDFDEMDEDGFALSSAYRPVLEADLPSDVFDGEDGIVFYVDGARHFPNNVTITKIGINATNHDGSFKSFTSENVCSLEYCQDVFNPLYELFQTFVVEKPEPDSPEAEQIATAKSQGKTIVTRRSDFGVGTHEGIVASAIDPTLTMRVKITTIDSESKTLSVVGLARINIFVAEDSLERPAPHAKKYRLNTGHFQIPIFMVPPEESNPISAESPDTVSRLPASALLVRIGRRPKIPVAIDEETGEEKKPEYKPYIPLPPPDNPDLYANLSYCPMLPLEPFIFKKHAIRMPKSVKEAIKEIVVDDQFELPPDDEITDLMYDLLSRKGKKEGILDFNYMAPYDDEVGFMVSIDCAQHLPKDVTDTVKALCTVSPPALIYAPESDRAGKNIVWTFYSEFHDDKAVIRAPVWQDGMRLVQNVPASSDTALIIELLQNKVNRKTKKRELASIGFCVLPIFITSSRAMHVRSGTFQLPLYTGDLTVLRDKFQSTDPIDVIAKCLKLKKKDPARIQYVEPASVFVRLLDAQRCGGELEDPISFDNIEANGVYAETMVRDLVPERSRRKYEGRERGKEILTTWPKDVELRSSMMADFAKLIEDRCGGVLESPQRITALAEEAEAEFAEYENM